MKPTKLKPNTDKEKQQKSDDSITKGEQQLKKAMDKAKEAEGKVSEPDEQPLEDLKDKVRDAPPLKNKNDKGAPGDSKKRMEDMMKK